MYKLKSQILETRKKKLRRDSLFLRIQELNKQEKKLKEEKLKWQLKNNQIEIKKQEKITRWSKKKRRS